jgi:hypothetical protein
MSVKNVIKKVIAKKPIAKISIVKKPVAKKPVAKKATVKKVAKKPVKKTTAKAVKKAPAKKATEKDRFRALVCAPGEQCFWTTDGKVMQDLDQLQMAFGTMGDEVFLHHVTKEKNDFADWVEVVLDDQECAKALRRAKKASSARTAVIKCLRIYNT